MKTQEEYIKEIELKLQAALHDLLSVSASITESCLYCKHYQECEHESCDCRDKECGELPFGECEKLRNTPCKGCDFRNHWKWRGVIETE